MSDKKATFKVKRIKAGCYYASYGNDEGAYIERLDDGSRKWVSECSEEEFDSYADARYITKTILCENASFLA